MNIQIFINMVPILIMTEDRGNDTFSIDEGRLGESHLLQTGVNPFMPTVPTFSVRETDVSRTANVGTVGKN